MDNIPLDLMSIKDIYYAALIFERYMDTLVSQYIYDIDLWEA